MPSQSPKHPNLAPRPWLKAGFILPWGMNLSLLACCGWLYLQSKSNNLTLSAPSAPALAPEALTPVPQSHTPPPVVTASPEFDWSQLESADFSIFIQRLRHIHCPETTIRDMVKAELEEIYAEKRKALRGGDAQGRNALAQEQADLLEKLLAIPGQNAAGSSVATTPAAEANRARRLRARDHISDGPPQLPLAFQELQQQAGYLGLSPTQLGALETLKAGFIEELGAGQIDPSSPEYAERWRSAQPMLDQRMRALLGDDWTARLRNARAESP